MGDLNQAALTSAFTSQPFGAVVDAVIRESKIINLLPEVPWPAGNTTVRVEHLYAGHTVSSYVEGDPPPASSNQSYVDSRWGETHAHMKLKITGHAEDFNTGNAVWYDKIARDSADAVRQMIYFYEQRFCGASTSGALGVRTIVDSSGTVATIDRSTNTWFRSAERTPQAGTNTPLTITDMDLLKRDVRARDGQVSVVLVNDGLLPVMRGLGFIPGAESNSVRVQMGENGPSVQLGYDETAMKYGTAPIVDSINLTSSELLMLDLRSWYRTTLRPVRFEVLGKAGDYKEVYVTMAMGWGCKRPDQQGKLTGIA